MNKDGDYIELWWDMCDPDVHAVRGHIDPSRAKTIISQWLEAEGCPPIHPEMKGPIHCYGRWAQTSYSKSMGLAGQLWLYALSGPGRFKVTVMLFTGVKVWDD